MALAVPGSISRWRKEVRRRNHGRMKRGSSVNVLYAVIAVLAVAVLVLGVLYYQERRDRIEVRINLPNISIEKK
jgi:uncharacterized membrane protein YidH (DUF202 family)